MIADGRMIAEAIYRSLAERRSRIGRPITLGILACGTDAASDSFIRIKVKAAARLDITIERVDLEEDTSTAEAIAAVAALAPSVDALIVQLPLPPSLDTDAVLAAIPVEKDADALNPMTPERERSVAAPVALAALEILERYGVRIEGARAVVVGAGRLVGAPAAALLAKRGARVSMLTLEEGSIDDLHEAAIIVSGAGDPHFITPRMLAPGVALIDAGTSELKGALAGDADPSCAEIASVFTPTPGGVGPIAVAMLFRNLLDLVERQI